MQSLPDLQFDNSFARLPAVFHSRVRPMPLAGAHMISVSPAAAGLVNLSADALHSRQALSWLVGDSALPGTDPVAMCYAGHQFGHYVPQLGDGRAMILGEVVNKRGAR